MAGKSVDKDDLDQANTTSAGHLNPPEEGGTPSDTITTGEEDAQDRVQEALAEYEAKTREDAREANRETDRRRKAGEDVAHHDDAAEQIAERARPKK